MKIIFAGTPDFAVPSLKTLIKNFDIRAVITKPDRPADRGQKTKPASVKEVSLQYNLKIFDAPIKQLKTEIKKLKPDLLITVAYGQIIPQEILDMPRFGALNLHPSLLPKYRGPSPIQAAILNNDKETGASIIKMTADLDAGPIIAQEKIKIAADETAGSLHDKLARLGAELLKKTLEKKSSEPADLAGSEPFHLHPQEHALATYTKKNTAPGARLDLSKPAQILERQIRAYNPWPGAWLKVKSSKLKVKSYRLKIWQAKIRKGSKPTTLVGGSEPFHLFICQNQPALLCGGGNLLILTEVQPEGRKKISGEEFARGYLN